MGRLFEFIASGAIMYVALAFCIVVLGLIVWKLPTIVYWAMCPFIWTWNWFVTTRPGLYLIRTRWWLWVEKQQYDPPPKPLTWWLSRGAVVLLFWAIISAAVFERGRVEGRSETPVSFIGTPPDGLIFKKLSIDYERKYRACQLELDEARVPEMPVKVIETVPVPSFKEPASPPVVAPAPIKMFKAPVTACAPAWLCKLDKAVGISK